MTTFVLDPSVDLVASVPRTSRPFQRRQYTDKQFLGGQQEWNKKLEESSTVYVGNLSCYTNEYQLYELFSRCGSIKRVIMGLNRSTKKPCGFCFVEFDEPQSARKSVKYLSRTPLDGRDIAVDLDAGFQEGRQFGRGASGGQVGDERRRESSGSTGRGGGHLGSGALLTRSITVVACLTMISLILILNQPQEVSAVETNLIFKPLILHDGYFGFGASGHSRYIGKSGRYVSLSKIQKAQMNKQRKQFETDLALFLVNLMKSAKPTLLKAFIKATLADKQLKETAIGMFLGTDEEASEESEKTHEKDKSGSDDGEDGEKDSEKEEDGERERGDKKETSKKKKRKTTAK